MKDFMKKAQPHMIPCIIGCTLGTIITGSSMIVFLFSLPMSITLATLICEKLGLSYDEIQKD